MAPESVPEETVLSLLTRQLAPKPRVSVLRRHEAMLRELQYLDGRQDENLTLLRKKHKWSDARWHALFAVNSVYQEVLGPLQASARSSMFGLGRETAILHGTQRFDAAHAARVSETLDAFFEMVAEMGFRRDWMSKNTCGDLVFYIARHARGDIPPDEAEAGDAQ